MFPDPAAKAKVDEEDGGTTIGAGDVAFGWLPGPVVLVIPTLHVPLFSMVSVMNWTFGLVAAEYNVFQLSTPSVPERMFKEFVSTTVEHRHAPAALAALAVVSAVALAATTVPGAHAISSPRNLMCVSSFSFSLCFFAKYKMTFFNLRDSAQKVR